MIHPLIYLGSVLLIPLAVVIIIAIFISVAEWYDGLDTEQQFYAIIGIPSVLGAVLIIIGLLVGV